MRQPADKLLDFRALILTSDTALGVDHAPLHRDPERRVGELATGLYRGCNVGSDVAVVGERDRALQPSSRASQQVVPFSARRWDCARRSAAVTRGPAGSGQSGTADVTWKNGSSNQLRSSSADAPKAPRTRAAATSEGRITVVDEG
jgi:hypothetical protein